MRRKRVLKPRDTPVTPDELREWREQRNWSQEDAARWLWVKLPTYQSWEQAKRFMKYPHLIRNRMQQARIRTKEEA